MSEIKTPKKSSSATKLKAKFESKAVQNLKKEFEQKLKKVKEKENAKIEKFHKEFSLSILEICINDKEFEKSLLDLLKSTKDEKAKKSYENLIKIYS